MTAPAQDLRRISVSIGQIAVSKDPNEVLVAYGLGSCIGVTFFDTASRVAGLIHVLLPDSEGRPVNPAEAGRFADTGIDSILRQLANAGVNARRMTVKLAGGASVLGPGNSEKFKIGERNAEAIKERLKHHGLYPAASDTGGSKGRTLELHVASGKTFVRTAASPASEL